METRNINNEPAFPCEHYPQDSTIEGMSKRFYAACSIMQGFMAQARLNNGEAWNYEVIARYAFKAADELLKQENL